MAAAATQDGAIGFTDSKGKRTGTLRVPSMWDGEVNPNTGEPVNVKRVSFALSAAGQDLTPNDPAKAGKLRLGVRADKAWLADPARAFPVTIDPTYASTAADVLFDTFVQEGYTTDESTDVELKLGDNGSGQVARSYLNVNSSGLAARKIMSATLSLYETWSWNCTATGWTAYDAGLASTSSRWTSQPTIGTQYATSTQTKGYSSSCPEGTVTIDMKNHLQAWADADSTSSKGVLLRAASETDSTYWKRFSSAEGAHPPKLTYTYNRAPATMAVPTIANTVAFTPVGSTTSYLYTADTTPNVSGVVSDPDGNTVQGRFYTVDYQGGPVISSCYSSTYVASGSSASCEMGTELRADIQVFLRSRGLDSNGAFGADGPWRELRVAANTPAAPVVSCPGYGDASWTTTPPSAAVSCTVTAAASGWSAPSKIRWSVDNGAYTDTAIPQSSSTSTAKTTVTVSQAAGGHNVRAYAISPVGKTSPLATYSFGYGSASLTAPAASPRMTTTGTIAIGAAGPPKGTSVAPTAKTQWRVSGASGTAGWKDAPAGNAVTVTETGGQSIASGQLNTTSLVGQVDASNVTVKDRVPTLIDVRVCYTYTSGTQCTGSSTVLRVPHAFGAGYPTADAGPGEVGLWTGELSVSDTDAELSAPGGSLSVSRSHTSFAGTPSAANKVFGPGWTASFDGDEDGAGGAEVLDATPVDGTLAVMDADGEALVFTTPTGARRTTTTLPTGTYKPADENTATAGLTAKVSGSGSSTVLDLTDDNGVVTRFQVTAAPTTAAATFKTVEVREPAVPGKTTYTYDASGRVTAIVAPLPDGVTACTPGTRTDGCRALKIVYATTTTATATATGDYAGQVKQILAQVNTDADRELAAYKYDSTGRLVEAKDSRTGLATSYGWTGTGTSQRLATLTPPGQAPYTFSYDTTANKLKNVTRPNPTSAGGGTAQLAAYVYGVPVTGTGLPDLGASSVARWAQASAPTAGFAVFGPEKPVTTISPAGIAATDWTYADLQYTDADGYTVNTAAYGAGDWQLTAADYDAHDNVTRAWDERALRGIIAGTVPGGGQADNAATVTVYNSDIKDGTGTVVTPAGTLVTDTYSPARDTTPAGVSAAAGTLPLRAHVHTVYDQGAPNSGINPDTGQPYRLPTKVVTTAETSDGTVDSTVAITLMGYDPLATGDVSGWKLGQPTSITTDMDKSGTVTAGDITGRARYDDRGRVIESRQPKSDGTDAGTRATVYYTAATSTVTACGSKPAYAGLVCQVGPAAQPAGQTMPVAKTTGYTWDAQPTTETEVSGAVTSTTTTSYDTADRPKTTSTTVSGLASSDPVPAVTTSYDTATGLTTGTSSSAGTTDATYDNWGRQVTYTNTPAGQAADTATTTYDNAGRVTSVVDGNGATSYSYDGTDAAGKQERRGLTTTIKAKVTGGQDYETTGAYDPAGDLTLEKLPGQIIRRETLDFTGDQTELTYNGQAADSTGTLVPDQPWLGWTTLSDTASRVTREWTPSGAAGYTGELGATAAASDRTYTYDPAGRLTKVQDRTGNPPPDTGVVPCTTRSYNFDANGNRTSQNTTGPDTNGDCTSSGGTPITRAYDTADRPTTGGNSQGDYIYDPLGRQTTIPAADAPHPDRGNLTLSYYDTDAAHTISQGTLGSGGTKTTFTLDSAGRRLTQTTQSDTGTATLVRHYTDDTDNPAWSVDTTGTSTTTTRYAELVDGDLGLTLTQQGSNPVTAELALATPRDDTATSITLPSGATSPAGPAASGLDDWTDYTEYGIPRQPATTTPGGTTGIGYGWLGATQRATTADTGLTLMGARLYNPSTGLFTSLDPLPGGNETAYNYPNDPINNTDIDGNCGWCRRAWRWAGHHKLDIVLTAASIIPIGGSAVWAYKVYRILRAARAVRGMGGGIRSWRITSRMAGRIWVGRGSRRTAVGRISRDRRRQYRRPARKGDGRHESNFEHRRHAKGKWKNNYHVSHGRVR